MQMQDKKYIASSVSTAYRTPQSEFPLTPGYSIPSTDGATRPLLPITPWHGVPPIGRVELQKEVPNRFSLCDVTTQHILAISHDLMQPKRKQSSQQSYQRTRWAFANCILDITDTLTRGRADWFQRLFSFLFVGGLGAVVNLICFSVVYNLLIHSINSFVAFLIAFMLATEVSIVTNFVLNDRLTFRNFHGQTRSWQMRGVRFHITSIGGTLLTLGISFFLLHQMHMRALLSQATALIIATAFNFVFHHIFTYRHGRGHTVTAHSNQPPGENIVVGPMPITKTNGGKISKSLKHLSMKTLIIIPTYNELENLPLLLKQIFSFAPETDVLIVDDNSPDGTGQLAKEIRKKNPRVNVLHRPGKLGLGTAYIAGFKYAIEHSYDAAFEMDADFSHDPCYLPNFLKAIESADLVIGSRYIPGGSTPNWSATRRLISGSGNIFARFMLGIQIHDCTGGFRCYRRSVLQNIDLDAIQSRGYAFQVELTYRVMRQGFKIVETPITFMDRRLGKSKMSRKIVIEAFTYVLRTRFSKQPSIKSNPPLSTSQHQWQEMGQQVIKKQVSNLTEMETQPNCNRIVMSMTATSPQDQLCTLRIVAGKQAGCIYEIQKKSMSIGRTHESDICLADPAISRLHASIVRTEDANYSIIDEGSANGTKLNDRILNKYQSYSLQEGDKIRLGHTILVFSKR